MCLDLKSNVSGFLRLSLRPFLGGTRTASTNSPAMKGLNTLARKVSKYFDDDDELMLNVLRCYLTY